MFTLSNDNKYIFKWLGIWSWMIKPKIYCDNQKASVPFRVVHPSARDAVFFYCEFSYPFGIFQEHWVLVVAIAQDICSP